MNYQLTPNGTWKAMENGSLIYIDKNIETFNIEPECIANPNLLFDLSCQPNFNMENFAPSYLIAAQNSGVEQLTIKLKDPD